MTGVTKNIRAIRRLIASWEANGTLDVGRKVEVERALGKIETGFRKKDLKLIQEGVARIARIAQR